MDFTGVNLTDCVFDHCEVTSPKLINTTIHGTTFKECKLLGADFTRCNSHLFTIAFSDCLIDTCNFSSLKLYRTPFHNCTIRETRFVSTILTEADFDRSEFSNTIFHQCNLQKANFHTARHYAIDPTANDIKGAKFSLPEAMSLLSGLGIELK